MDFLKKVLVFVAASTFTLLLFLTVTTTALSTIINPGNVKNWLKHSDIYYGAVDTILDSTATAAKNNAKDSSDIFSKPEVKNAVKSAFPPSLLQSSTENFIDGTFVWLEGKSPQPTFRIDLTQAKTNLANNLAKYAQDRYKTLPICKTLPSVKTDPMDATCRVPDYDITKDVQKFKKDLINNKKLFGNPPVITAESIKSGDGSKQSFFEKASAAPGIYKLTKIAPLIFGFLAVLGALTLVFLSNERRKGIKRTALSLIYASVLLFLLAWAIHFGLGKASANLIDSGNSANAFAQKTALSIGRDIGNHVVHVNIYFGIAFVILGIGLLVVAKKKVNTNPSKTENTDSSTPVPV